MEKYIYLDQFAGGVIGVQFNEELEKVLKNCLDEKTDATAKRKIVLTCTIFPNEKRNEIRMDFEVKSKLASPMEVSSRLAYGKDPSGRIHAIENKIGMPEQDRIDLETGEIIPGVVGFPREV